ncbi:MAG: hypothetical protein GX075_02100 [Firmicutes bacterium]|nr:hypothetical protein [Bacillota bacterium]
MSAVGKFIKNIDRQYRDFKTLASGNTPSVVIQGEGATLSGRQLQAILAEYEIGDIPGIEQWFEAMTEDFLAPQGLPLPFAEALQRVTGMPPTLALEWLETEIAAVSELTTEEEVMAFFRKNPKVYSACFVLGIAFGLYSDNPALVSASGLQYFIKLKREGRLQQGIWINTDRFIRASFALIDRICTITFIAEAACKMAGISFARLSEDLAETIGLGKKLAALSTISASAVNVADVIGGVANIGFSMLVGKAVGKMVEWLNDDLKQQLESIASQVEVKLRLRELLKEEAPPETIVPLIELMKEEGTYRLILSKN